MYEKDPMRNETLLYFAKIDYNLVQLLHLQELSSITMWWKDAVSKFPYVRDRIVECYFWSLGVYFEPSYSVSRVALTKVVGMILLLDDTFDSYGTLGELKVFKDVVGRWDANASQELPDYLDVLYKILLCLIEELDEQFTKKGYCGVSYVKQEAKDIVISYYTEAEWFMEGRMPSFGDYLANGLVTGTHLVCIMASLLGMKEVSTSEKAFEWLRNRPKASVAVATIWRLLDDIATYENKRMKVVAAYLLVVLGGNLSPTAEDIKGILSSGLFVFEVLNDSSGDACNDCITNCTLDHKFATNCGDKRAYYVGLSNGNHTFMVCSNGFQSFGCTTYNWIVDTIPPAANISAATSFTNAINISVNISFTEPCPGKD